MFEGLGAFALLALLVCPLMMVGMAAFAWIAGKRSGGQGEHAGHGMMCHGHAHRTEQTTRGSSPDDGGEA